MTTTGDSSTPAPSQEDLELATLVDKAMADPPSLLQLEMIDPCRNNRYSISKMGKQVLEGILSRLPEVIAAHCAARGEALRRELETHVKNKVLLPITHPVQLISDCLEACQQRLAASESEVAGLRAKVERIRLEVDGYIDGAPDAGPVAKLANAVSLVIDPDQQLPAPVDKNAARLHWLHDCSTGTTDLEGYEWGIYRVKWNKYGQVESIYATDSNFNDLDTEMEREAALRPAHTETKSTT